jgi:hypothetical protein
MADWVLTKPVVRLMFQFLGYETKGSNMTPDEREEPVAAKARQRTPLARKRKSAIENQPSNASMASVHKERAGVVRSES